MSTSNPVLDHLPEPGRPIFYPKVGHCIFKGVIEDRVAPGTELLELEDLEEESRILIPVARVPKLNLRPAGVAFDEIKSILGEPFEEPIEDESERQRIIEEQISLGSPESLSKALKRLHLLRQTEGLSREEEQLRKKVRSWLAAEVALARESTRAEAQAFMTRVLQDAMQAHRAKEKEEAKERRRAAKAAKAAELDAALGVESPAPEQPTPDSTPADVPTEPSARESEGVGESPAEIAFSEPEPEPAAGDAQVATDSEAQPETGGSNETENSP